MKHIFSAPAESPFVRQPVRDVFDSFGPDHPLPIQEPDLERKHGRFIFKEAYTWAATELLDELAAMENREAVTDADRSAAVIPILRAYASLRRTQRPLGKGAMVHFPNDVSIEEIRFRFWGRDYHPTVYAHALAFFHFRGKGHHEELLEYLLGVDASVEYLDLESIESDLVEAGYLIADDGSHPSRDSCPSTPAFDLPPDGSTSQIAESA